MGQQLGFVRFAAYFSLLDTGLRRYDDLMDHLGLNFLKQNGCMAYQGYLFGKPVPIDELEALLNRN